MKKKIKTVQQITDLSILLPHANCATFNNATIKLTNLALPQILFQVDRAINYSNNRWFSQPTIN